MDGWGYAIGAGTEFINNIYSNAANRSLYENQKQWQTYMSNTAHQREVADLKAAGLNPILSAMNGSTGASTGSVQQPEMKSPMDGVSKWANSALRQLEYENAKQQVEINEKDYMLRESKNDAEVRLLNAQASDAENSAMEHASNVRYAPTYAGQASARTSLLASQNVGQQLENAHKEFKNFIVNVTKGARDRWTGPLNYGFNRVVSGMIHGLSKELTNLKASGDHDGFDAAYARYKELRARTDEMIKESKRMIAEHNPDIVTKFIRDIRDFMEWFDGKVEGVYEKMGINGKDMPWYEWFHDEEGHLR